MFDKVRESKLSAITAISFLPAPVSETLLRHYPWLPGLGNKKQTGSEKTRSRGDVIVRALVVP
jgi:hypothetical protein